MTEIFDKRITPARPDLAAERLRGHVEAARFLVGGAMRVVDECVDVRPEPRRDRSIDTQALYGERVTVYELDGEGWAWGQLDGDSYVGYLPAEALRNDIRAPTHFVSAARTFVYPEPNMKTPVVMALPMGARVYSAATRDGFAEIAGLGFAWAGHLALEGDFAADFVEIAERFLHAPYLWGGKTFAGLDCSGLVQISLHACGIAAPRDTDMMERALGAEIPAGAELRRGDLVFWKGHVGVMRDAETLLHANGHHMAVVSEPLKEARARIAAKSFGAVTSARRL